MPSIRIALEMMAALLAHDRLQVSTQCYINSATWEYCSMNMNTKGTLPHFRQRWAGMGQDGMVDDHFQGAFDNSIIISGCSLAIFHHLMPPC